MTASRHPDPLIISSPDLNIAPSRSSLHDLLEGGPTQQSHCPKHETPNNDFILVAVALETHSLDGLVFHVLTKRYFLFVSTECLCALGT